MILRGAEHSELQLKVKFSFCRREKRPPVVVAGGRTPPAGAATATATPVPAPTAGEKGREGWRMPSRKRHKERNINLSGLLVQVIKHLDRFI